MTNAFNNDKDFVRHFQSHYEADKLYYSSPYFNAGERGRWGLGAGPDQSWCSGGLYDALKLENRPNQQKCRVYSPYSVAGYMPADPENISQDLLDLMADGESTMAFEWEGEDYHILSRKSMLNPEEWSQGKGQTMVDFSSEILGLSTLWLEPGFF